VVEWRGLTSAADDLIIMSQVLAWGDGGLLGRSVDLLRTVNLYLEFVAIAHEVIILGEWFILHCLEETVILARGRCLSLSRSLLDFLDNEDLVLMDLLVHWQLASLSESLGAAFIWAFKWLLAGVNVRVLFQILSKCKFLKTNHTHEGLGGLVSSVMSSQREAGCELLVTVGVFAFVRSFHV
jgi:hypothetical protein